ncbi:hypothetical protein [Streptomyces sp. TS71-3]|uniref:hypothetical protein n=1 Tax=Streptomyces sp. TS71-3 TaxID=2733862 RepID=UPI001B20EF07|nr:hypothetical protein [Streptomyces sp. TS71-3]GHJ40925.1 hypothetical protein Sm713_65340 [Streptomyces sp. TS71-3]
MALTTIDPMPSPPPTPTPALVATAPDAGAHRRSTERAFPELGGTAATAEFTVMAGVAR